MISKIIEHLKNSNLPVILIGADNLSGLKDSLKIDEADFLSISEEIIKIENTREIIRFLSLKPYSSQAKLVIIYQADKMTAEAANNLLKILEEPPAYARIILTTQNEKLIIPTIMSRCRKIKVPVKIDAENLVKPENYLSPDDLAKMSVSRKFSWVAEIVESPDIELILTLWQEHFRKKMKTGMDVISILREISKSKDLLLTNISVKLLLENLVLEFDSEK